MDLKFLSYLMMAVGIWNQELINGLRTADYNGISIDYDKDKAYKNHNRHSHVCRLYFSDESRNCTKFEYSCLRGNGTVYIVCGSSYFERMVLQDSD